MLARWLEEQRRNHHRGILVWTATGIVYARSVGLLTQVAEGCKVSAQDMRALERAGYNTSCLLDDDYAHKVFFKRPLVLMLVGSTC